MPRPIGRRQNVEAPEVERLPEFETSRRLRVLVVDDDVLVAMNTTAFGLIVAIPLLVVHAVLASKTGDIVDSLEMATVKTLNVFSKRAKRQLDIAA